jgi:hypothetical protein
MPDQPMPDPPLFVTPAEVGRACNVSRRAAKTLLRGARIAELDERNGRWFVRSERLRERLPDVYARVREAFAAKKIVPEDGIIPRV